jgi:hypothetical protein
MIKAAELIHLSAKTQARYQACAHTHSLAAYQALCMQHTHTAQRGVTNTCQAVLSTREARARHIKPFSTVNPSSSIDTAAG